MLFGAALSQVNFTALRPWFSRTRARIAGWVKCLLTGNRDLRNWYAARGRELISRAQSCVLDLHKISARPLRARTISCAPAPRRRRPRSPPARPRARAARAALGAEPPRLQHARRGDRARPGAPGGRRARLRATRGEYAHAGDRSG